MTLTRQLLIGFVLLVVILLVEKYTDSDVWLQNFFYNPQSRDWIINPALHKELSFIFYKGLKEMLALLGIGCLLYLLASFKYTKFKSKRRPILILVLSLIFVPIIVAGAKYITNVYCPYQLDIYNGLNPFVRIIDNYPQGFVQLRSGRCFPAGHATAGFALMSLYFVFSDKKKKFAGLALGITLGLMAGGYQMLRGQHFLSHTLFSMVASFMVILIIQNIINRSFKTHEAP